MILLFEMLDRQEINFFFPSILYNESFWRASSNKRLAIITHFQFEWFGTHPIQRACFHKDPFYIELIHSIKLSYLSSPKITLSHLIDILKIKTNFVISDFHPFGNEMDGPIATVNRLAQEYLEAEKISTKPNINPIILAKLASVKFYTKFIKKKSIKCIAIGLRDQEIYWEHFFKSLKLLDSKQNTNIIQKLSFYFLTESASITDNIIQNTAHYPILKEMIDNGKIQFDVFRIEEFAPKDKIDYIHVYFILGKQPVDILIKHNDKIFYALGRIGYNKRFDNNEALEKLAILQSPIKVQSKINREDIMKLDTEIIFEEYPNKNAIELIENNIDFLDRSIIRFSIPILTFLINSINALSNSGYIEIWDTNENENTPNTIGLTKNIYAEFQAIVYADLYNNIITSLPDLQVVSSIRPIYSVLASEIMSRNDMIITLDTVFRYVTERPLVSKKFFHPENFIFHESLVETQKSLKFFETLKRKKIITLGLSSLLYKIGLKKFKKKILSFDTINKLISSDSLDHPQENTYVKETMLAILPKILEKAANRKDTIVSRQSDAKINKEFYEFLEENGLIKEKILAIINEEWDELVVYAQNSTNYTLFEIARK